MLIDHHKTTPSDFDVHTDAANAYSRDHHRRHAHAISDGRWRPLIYLVLGLCAVAAVWFLWSYVGGAR